MSFNFVCLKYNIKNAHWVGKSELISLDIDDFFKRTPFVDGIQASVTGNTIKQSASERKESRFVTRRRIKII